MEPITYNLRDLEQYLRQELAATAPLMENSLSETIRMIQPTQIDAFSQNFFTLQTSRPVIGFRQRLLTLNELSDETFAKWYSKEWQDLIIDIQDYAERKGCDPRNFWYDYCNRFVLDLLHQKPHKKLFFRHGEFDQLKDLAFRDKIIHATGVYRLGWLFLQHENQRGYARLWDMIKNSPISDIGSILNKDLATLEPREIAPIIDIAWDIVARCHDWVHFGPDSIASDHGRTAQTILETEYNHFRDQLPPNIRAATSLALNAIRYHCVILQQIGRNRDSSTMKKSLVKAWQENPLGAFLSLILIVHDLAIRVCWHPSTYGNKVRSRPNDILLIEEIRLSIEPNFKIQFVGNKILCQKILGSPPRWDPMKPRTAQWLAKAFGPECFAMVSQELDTVGHEWIPQNENNNSKKYSGAKNPVHLNLLLKKIDEIKRHIDETQKSVISNIRNFDQRAEVDSEIREGEMKNSINYIEKKFSVYKQSISLYQSEIEKRQQFTEKEFQVLMSKLDELKIGIDNDFLTAT